MRYGQVLQTRAGSWRIRSGAPSCLRRYCASGVAFSGTGCFGRDAGVRRLASLSWVIRRPGARSDGARAVFSPLLRNILGGILNGILGGSGDRTGRCTDDGKTSCNRSYFRIHRADESVGGSPARDWIPAFRGDCADGALTLDPGCGLRDRIRSRWIRLLLPSCFGPLALVRPIAPRKIPRKKSHATNSTLDAEPLW